MNNNCTKCGNPLQPGTTICPVCGTNNINATAQGVAQGVTAQTPVQPAPAQVAATPATEVAPAVAPAQAAVETPTIQPAPAVQPATPIAQTTQPAAPAQPGIPTPQAMPANPEATKKPANKKLFIIVGVIAAVIIIGAVVAMLLINNSASGNNEVVEPTNNSNDEPEVVSNKTRLSLNGYSFELADGWNTDTTNGTVTLYDDEQTTIVQLLNTAGDLNDFDTEASNEYLEGLGYTDISVDEMTDNGKLAYVISGTYSDYQFEFYYIESEDFVVGSSVIYTDENAKSNNQSIVSEMMMSLEYAEAVNAISELDMFSNTSETYKAILNSESTNNAEDEDTLNNGGGTTNNDGGASNGGGTTQNNPTESNNDNPSGGGF